MACRGRCPAVFPVWFLWLAICCSGVGSEPEGNAIGHEPPVLKPVRWQRLDKCYQDVFVDAAGRAWFFCTTPAYSGYPKWAYLVCPELPDKTIQMLGENAPLGFDGRNRFWDIGRHGLCCTDVHRDTFFQRAPAESTQTRPRVSAAGVLENLPFVRSMFEDSSGRLYFCDVEGGYVLDGDKWSYQKFTPPLQDLNHSRNMPFSNLRVVEGARGEVYAWSVGYAPDGGLQAYDGAGWKSYAKKDFPVLGSFRDILPQSDGSICVQVAAGYEESLTLPGLAAQSPAAIVNRDPARDARNARFRRRWEPTILVDFTGDELAAYGNFLAKDSQGRAYFFALPPPGGLGHPFGWMAVFDSRYQENVPSLKYECFRLDNGFHTACLDSEGRLWARLSVEDQPFLSLYDGGWKHFADPTGWTRERYPDYALIKRSEQFWLMVPRRHIAEFLPSRSTADFEAAEKAAPGMANPGFLQPLRDGAIVAAELGLNRAHLFDGREWSVHNSLRELVEAKYEWLKGHIDNAAHACRYWSSSAPTSLGRDATGRVWLAQYKFNKAYDGKNWSETPEGRVGMNGSGDRTAVDGKLFDSSVWPPKGLTALPGGNRSDVWFGRRSSIWARGEDPYFIHRFDGKRFAKVEFSVENLPLLEDSAGRFWLSRLDGWQLLYPDGQTSAILQHNFTMRAPVVEQGRGIFWAFASDGLLRLHVEEPKGGKPKIVIDKHFPRLIPQGEIAFLGLDRHNNLWLATQSGKSGLYRIELPPLEGARP